MFYSQFILAKKGPLGTIWIAAHLERKLRKNQVADTDIGVSVDSILFPEVPIALRLSSHLLLGVVRIYSRKVNYLFDDCSEALLKIKQAFRSTAVDLPPEESTAPYHSITLPETFDLDDFELPDNDIFQGNYVDHHISTREQITLQDTMEGVVYSTSQFGLDERFGDGDTSHVGLDLEEDLFLDKVAAPGLDEVSEANLQTANEPETPMIDESYNMIGTSEAMPVNGTRNKMDILATNSESTDYAHAPSTPGLEGEPNLCSVQEGLACDDHLESEDHHVTELVIERTGNASRKSDFHHGDEGMDLSSGNHLNNGTFGENGCLSSDLEINQEKLHGDLPTTAVTMGCLPADGTLSGLDGSDKMEEINNVLCNGKRSGLSVDGINGEYGESLEFKPSDFEIANDVKESGSLEKSKKSNDGCQIEWAGTVDALASQGPEDPDTLSNHVDHEKMHTCMGVLRACNSHLHQPDTLSHGVGTDVLPPETQNIMPCSLETSRGEEALHASGTSTQMLGEEHVADGMQAVVNQISEPSVHGEIQGDGGKLDEQHDNAIFSDNQLENLHSSLTSDLPAPEKLLSVPQRLLDKPNDLLIESTPNKEVVEGGDRSSAGTNVSGKKRSFTESSLTVQSLNSVESFGVTRSKRTLDSVPDDDDLLSSILVGRRSSVLKMKPTPPAPEVVSMKRARSASRPSASKRKVLMDDSMVLLGDTIRQQLTSTEDIRRLRRKAPCTRTEILMIQRQFLDEEIFSEPVLTGMSAEMTCLHIGRLDLSSIKICGNDDNNTSSEVAKDRPTDNEMEASTEPLICRADADGQPAENHIQTENQQGEDHQLSSDIVNQGQMNSIADAADYRSSEHETFGEIIGMEIDRGNTEVVDAANHTAVMQFEASNSELASGDANNMLGGSVLLDGTVGADASLQLDTSLLDHYTEDVAFGTEVREEGEISLEESKVGALVEVRQDIQAAGSALPDDAETLLGNLSSETGGCINITSVNVDQTQDNVENDELGVSNEGDIAVSSGQDDKDRDSNNPLTAETKSFTLSVGLDGDDKHASLNDVDYPVCQDADQHRTADTEISSVENHAVGDSGDLRGVAFANDTEFLNVDDDEMGEDDDDGMPGPEDARLLDNSGWSSRTRAVAKYLQILFDNEAGNGRKILSVNSLLAGKTRKEASRMFFETLVLKTRDYVHVEQSKPFDNINIKPRAKLMKSDF